MMVDVARERGWINRSGKQLLTMPTCHSTEYATTDHLLHCLIGAAHATQCLENYDRKERAGRPGDARLREMNTRFLPCKTWRFGCVRGLCYNPQTQSFV